MRTSLFAPIFGVCLIIQLSNSQIICDKNHYTVVYSNGTFKRCLPCSKCHEGYGLYPPCGNTLFHPPMTAECRSCKAGTFSSKYDSSSCKACHQCAEHEIKEAECTKKSDTACSGKCEQGYFMSKTVHNCHECSACCSDGKDEKIKECVSLGIKNKECSPRPDKTCAGQPPTTDATKGSGSLAVKYLIIIIVATIVVAIAVVIMIVMVCLRQRGNSGSSVQGSEAPVAKQRNGSARIASQAYANDVGPQTQLRQLNATVSAIEHSASNPMYQGTPTQHPKNNPKPTPARGTPLQDVATETLKTRDSNSDESGPGSQESKTDGQFRTRRLSSKSIGEVFETKPYKRGNSLLESEEGLETHVPIKIAKHPKSQKVDEGSKVILECKLEKNSQHFLYQWYRDDGSEVNGEDESVLVLNPVELKDFGSYHCRVSYIDPSGESKCTKPAKLEVRPIPGPKCLSEVDFHTMDPVPSLLGSENLGLVDWRGIGSKYGMNRFMINELANAAPSERGRGVLAFLQTSQPSMTVYEFCRTLKEESFKRFDIVKELENHFLVESCRDLGN